MFRANRRFMFSRAKKADGGGRADPRLTLGFMRRFALLPVLIAVIAVLAPPAATEAPATYQLTILHTNDFHGQDPYALARRATLIKRVRAEVEQVLLLDAGDVFTRGPFGTVFYGELEFAAMNAMVYDAMTLGNNEFKAAPDMTARDYLDARIKQAAFPVLCANIVLEKSGDYLPGVKPYFVKTVGALRIGIFGVSANRIREYGQAQGLIINDQLAVAAVMAPKVAAEADLVLALTHIGYDVDQQLARTVPGLLAIVGGDSHTILREPVMINGVPIVQAGGESSVFLGRLDLTLTRQGDKWTLKEYRGQLYPITKQIPEDPPIAELVRDYLKRTEPPVLDDAA